MSRRKKDQLGQVLRQWADNHVPDTASLEQLRQRIATALDDSSPAGPTPAIADLHGNRSSRPWVWACVSVAAAVILVAVAIGYQSIGQKQASPTTSPEGQHDPRSLAVVPGRYLAGRSTLLSEMELLFADQVKWIVESEGRVVDLSLLEQGEMAGGEIPVAVRLVVVRREPGQRDWSKVREWNVITYGQQLVQWNSKATDNVELLIWTYALPDGMTAMDTHLAIHGTQGLQVRHSGVLSSGKPTKIFSTRQGESEYQVLQTVMPLKQKVG